MSAKYLKEKKNIERQVLVIVNCSLKIENSGNVILSQNVFLSPCFVTAAGVVPCGGPKSSLVHRSKCSLYVTFGPLRLAEIFCEIRNIIGLDSHILSRCFLFSPFIYLDDI